jgi:hypothetical protein
MKDNEGNFKKLQMNISDRSLNDLKNLQDELEAASMAEVVRASLKIFKYLQEQKKTKEIILRDKTTKKETELII